MSQASEDASFDEKEKLDEDEPGEDELSVVSDDLRQPRGLLDLPDELLSPIFYQVYEILRTSQATDGTREPIPTHCLALNKRLAALVRPIWCRDLFSPPSASIGSYLNTVLSVPGVRDLLRTVDIVITSPEPTLYLTLLAHYAGIASLTLDIDPAASKDSPHTVSKAITRLLRQLPRLSYLDLRRCADTDDPDLDLAVDVPALSSLAVNTGAWCDGNVQRGCENIRFLELRTSTLAGICIPPSPQHLRFRPMLGRSCDDNLSVVPLKGFLKEVPIRRLSLDFATLGAARDRVDRTFELLDVLEDLSASKIRQLDIRAAASFGLPEELPTTPLRIRTLTITGGLRVHTCLPALTTFLSLFSSLTAFHLRGALFSDTEMSAAAMSERSVGALAVRLPHLAAFVVFLRSSTRVLDFRFRLEDERKEVRWKRKSRHEEFKRESWSW